MQKITVTIHWSDPDDLCQITADHIKMALSRYCTNTTFEVEASPCETNIIGRRKRKGEEDENND